MSKYTLKQFQAEYPTDAACLDTIMEIQYGGKSLVCPACGADTTFHRIAKRRAYACKDCGHHIYPCVGTPFEKSRTPLTNWFFAMYLMTTTRHGVAAKELERQIGCTYKTAWRMAHEIRKHMANAEARVVSHNLLHSSTPEKLPFSLVPSAVFGEPQIASVGATEQDLQTDGRPYVAATRPYSDAAFGWALEDDTGFVKILADPDSRLILGVHIIGPQASILIQPLLQAMCLGNNVDDVARRVLYIHPALSEVVDQTLLAL